jgi:hypothetical protein
MSARISPASARQHTETRSRCVVLIAFLLLILNLPTLAFADSNTTVTGLTNAGQQIDGQDVSFEGEVVGDILNAEPGFKWLLVRDGNDSLSVLIAADDAEKITHLGRYNETGTRIEVRGIFEIDCAEHDGQTDVHATKITVLDEGSLRESDFSARELEVGALLIVIGACLYVLHWRLRERTR